MYRTVVLYLLSGHSFLSNSINGARDLAVMGVLSPGLKFSGWDRVGTKIIEATKVGGQVTWGAWEGRVKEKPEDTGVWTNSLRWNKPSF